VLGSGICTNLERENIASGWSGSAGSGILLQTEGNRAQLDLILEVFCLFQDLDIELEEELEHRQERTLIAAKIRKKLGMFLV
jgi:hypothetical protein